MTIVSNVNGETNLTIFWNLTQFTRTAKCVPCRLVKVCWIIHVTKLGSVNSGIAMKCGHESWFVWILDHVYEALLNMVIIHITKWTHVVCDCTCFMWSGSHHAFLYISVEPAGLCNFMMWRTAPNRWAGGASHKAYSRKLHVFTFGHARYVCSRSHCPWLVAWKNALVIYITIFI